MTIGRYKELFSGGLGRYTGGKATLRVREGAVPVFHRARPLPFALRDRVDAELDAMLRDGIIEPVDCSDWASPLVPVNKPDGSLIICADYKSTLNPVLLTDRRFTLRTDQKPLVSIFGPNPGIPPSMVACRMQRWAIILSAYTFDIEYVRTDENGADGFSRLPLVGSKQQQLSLPEQTYLHLVQQALLLDYNVIKKESLRDHILSKVLYYIRKGWPSHCEIDQLQPYFNRQKELYEELGCVMWGHRLVVPESCRQKVLLMIHEPHMGIVKSKALARSYVWWCGIDEAVEQMCRECEVCAAAADPPLRHQLRMWPWPSRPWTRLHLDYMGPIAGKSYLVVVDATSKWLEVFNVSTGTSASVLVHKLTELFSSKEGIQEKQNINKALWTFLMHYRNVEHAATGESPARLLIGRQIRTRLDSLKPDIENKVIQAQQRQKDDSGGVNRSMDLNEDVWYRQFLKGEKWVPGRIIDRIGPSNFKVLGRDGETRHRHIDQLRRRPSRFSLASATPSVGTDSSAQGVCIETPVRQRSERWSGSVWSPGTTDCSQRASSMKIARQQESTYDTEQRRRDQATRQAERASETTDEAAFPRQENAQPIGHTSDPIKTPYEATSRRREHAQFMANQRALETHEEAATRRQENAQRCPFSVPLKHLME
ncbi:hypothetical protein evm_004093 [Chilo suppressalis]|nr:hypothetical protein evm_004093 [Chilo suppressalis]